MCYVQQAKDRKWQDRSNTVQLHPVYKQLISNMMVQVGLKKKGNSVPYKLGQGQKLVNLYQIMQIQSKGNYQGARRGILSQQRGGSSKPKYMHIRQQSFKKL